jgi:fructokinase
MPRLAFCHLSRCDLFDRPWIVTEPAGLIGKACVLGALSRDFLGERLLRALFDEGVDTASIARVDAPTTLGLVGTDARGVPSYAFYGEGGADRELGVDAIGSLPTTVDAVNLGSFSTVVEPIASTLRTLVEREHTRALISYDPNIRLNVAPDLAQWRNALQWMLPRTHLLKISEEDLSLLLPDTNPQQFAGNALAQGARLIVVTRGEGGATAWTASTTVAVSAVQVPVVDTVGAGDTFQAALLAWLAEHNCLSPDALSSLVVSQLIEALQYRLFGQHGVDVGIQLLQHRCRRAGRNEQRHPGGLLAVPEALLHGSRNIRQARHTLVADHGERLDLTALDELDRRRHGETGKRYVPAEQRVEKRRRARERHRRNVDLGQHLEDLLGRGPDVVVDAPELDVALGARGAQEMHARPIDKGDTALGVEEDHVGRVLDEVPVKVANLRDLILLKMWAAPERPGLGKRLCGTRPTWLS